MKTLAEFLARHINDRNDYFGPNAKSEYEEMIKWHAEDLDKGINAYKEHLRNDSPKTVHWAMIERDLITALERMQFIDSLENGAIHDNYKTTSLKGAKADEIVPNIANEIQSDINKVKYHCLQPTALKTDLGCVKCSSLLACTNNENRECNECLLFDLAAQGNCKEPGYGTKADNRACDRFKLGVCDGNDICPFPAARIKFGCDDCQLHPTCEIQNVKPHESECTCEDCNLPNLNEI